MIISAFLINTGFKATNWITSNRLQTLFWKLSQEVPYSKNEDVTGRNCNQVSIWKIASGPRGFRIEYLRSLIIEVIKATSFRILQQITTMWYIVKKIGKYMVHFRFNLNCALPMTNQNFFAGQFKIKYLSKNVCQTMPAPCNPNYIDNVKIVIRRYGNHLVYT